MPVTGSSWFNPGKGLSALGDVFTGGTTGTPAQVGRREKYAQGLLQEAADTSPIGPGNPWAMVGARVGKGLLGGMQQFGADESERIGKEGASEAYRKALEGGMTAEEAAGVLDNEWASKGQQAVAEAYLTNELKDDKGQIVPKGAMVYKDGQWVTPPAGQVQPDIEDWSKLNRTYEGTKAVENYRASVPILGSMRASLSDNSIIRDLDFVYGVAKIMDPESVVREGEAATIANSQSIPEQVRGQLLAIIGGKGKLTPDTRKALYELARERTGQLHQQASSVYQNIVKQGGYYNIPGDRFQPLDPMPGEAPAEQRPPTQEEILEELRRRGQGG